MAMVMVAAMRLREGGREREGRGRVRDWDKCGFSPPFFTMDEISR